MMRFEQHVLDCLMSEHETFSSEIWRRISRYEHFLLSCIAEAIADQSEEVRNQLPALLTADLPKYLKSVEEFVDIWTGELNFRPHRIKVTGDACIKRGQKRISLVKWGARRTWLNTKQKQCK